MYPLVFQTKKPDSRGSKVRLIKKKLISVRATFAYK